LGTHETGDHNVAIGNSSQLLQLNGANNTSVGGDTLYNLAGGSDNAALGYGSLVNLTSGNENTALGSSSMISSTSGSNNICIGYFSTTATATASNSITLGNSSNNVLRCNVTSITSLSDARDKKEIKDLSVGLEFVNGLKPVEFVWNDREEIGKHEVSDFGFIAQDLKASQEEVEMAETLKLVYEENPEKLEASYGKLIPILVKAIQELSEEVKQLKK
jgi:hypothetical protein